ncbi:MAG: hypothetical protein JOZ80_02635 [Acidobacteriaceae bacterium]|nr:hypothetical protein [Acidobacteriaceae bacterium]
MSAFQFAEVEDWGFGSATDAVALPKPKPGTMSLSLIVLAIGSRDVARAQRARVGHIEDALQRFNLGNDTFDVHVRISIPKRLAL